MTTAAPLPTLPPQWTLPSTCQDTTQVRFVSFYGPDTTSDTWVHNIFGVPAVNTMLTAGFAGDCLAPQYDLDAPYLTDGGCPDGYVERCVSPTSYRERSADLVTCCPSVNGDWDFTCDARRPGTSYGCKTDGTEGLEWSGTYHEYYFSSYASVISADTWTTTIGSHQELYAYGVILLRTESTAKAAETNTSQPQNETNGLSTGAAIGIGIAAGIIAAAIFGVAAFIFIRRRRLAREAAAADEPSRDAAPGPYQMNYDYHRASLSNAGAPAMQHYSYQASQNNSTSGFQTGGGDMGSVTPYWSAASPSFGASNGSAKNINVTSTSQTFDAIQGVNFR